MIPAPSLTFARSTGQKQEHLHVDIGAWRTAMHEWSQTRNTSCSCSWFFPDIAAPAPARYFRSWHLRLLWNSILTPTFAKQLQEQKAHRAPRAGSCTLMGEISLEIQQLQKAKGNSSEPPVLSYYAAQLSIKPILSSKVQNLIFSYVKNFPLVFSLNSYCTNLNPFILAQTLSFSFNHSYISFIFIHLAYL